MAMRIKLEDDEPVEIQMAPLIDCMFLLLIFFLVATTLKKMSREVPLELPYAEAALEAPEEANLLVLSVDRQEALYVNGTPVTRELCFEHLREAYRDKLPVRLDADKEVRYETILEVIEMCHIEGIDNVGLHTLDARRLGK